MNAAVTWFDAHGRISTNNSSGKYYNYYSDTAGTNRRSERAPGYKARLDVLAASKRKVLVTLNFCATPAPVKNTTADQLQRAKNKLVSQINSVWNKHRLVIKVFVLDERGQPTSVSRFFNVEFRIRWTQSNSIADYVLCVYPKSKDLPATPG